MVKLHNLGFPRIGIQRELKFALERYWQNKDSSDDLQQIAQQLRHAHWQYQDKLDFIPVGDFSFYDQVLDTSFLLGNIPERANAAGGTLLDKYFRVARGRAPIDAGDSKIAAGEMTKWFDTNYHYIVPEFHAETRFSLNPENLSQQIKQAQTLQKNLKPTLIGPLTYLWLGKSRDGSDKLALLERLLPVYADLLNRLAEQGIEWVELDEPILVTELNLEWKNAFNSAYTRLQTSKIKILLATYFGQLHDNLRLACELPVQGLHLDAVCARDEVLRVIDWLPSTKILSLGIVDGRNIWKTDLNALLDWLEPVHDRLQQRLWLAPSCSLLHVPVDLNQETGLDPQIRSWLAFAVQKLDELAIIAQALNQGRESCAAQLKANAETINSRRNSSRVHNSQVQQRLEQIDAAMIQRTSEYAKRVPIQRQKLNLPPYPTTTIGSFPQTQDIRKARKKFKNGEWDWNQYQQFIQQQIAQCIRFQEDLRLDVLVHGEAERNDMVAYFGELLEGYAFTENGWVQSYGSRCVRPPVLFGDISRPQAMTVAWIQYAQSLTDKPVKGMLTGPVTLLNWSFVRDDQPRADTCMQLALAIRDEVLELEAAGTPIIQIDEAALREGLPLRKSQWPQYLDWAIRAFRLAANGVKDETQIHTHMCYSEFNDIIESIAAMDADVISIETSRSDMELLDAFEHFAYPNEIGPGVYDIHSPNTPSVKAMVQLMQKAAERIPAERLWINPDCGLKTRRWEEVKPALHNMVQAARQLRHDCM